MNANTCAQVATPTMHCNIGGIVVWKVQYEFITNLHSLHGSRRKVAYNQKGSRQFVITISQTTIYTYTGDRSLG
jgi:hypothetical protein